MPDSVLLEPPPALADSGSGGRGRGGDEFDGDDGRSDRPDGSDSLPINNARLLVILLLIASTMLFCGFIFSYVVQRGAQPESATAGLPKVPSLWPNSLCVLASSLFLVLAHVAQRRGRAGALKLWLLASLGAAIAFLIVQIRLWKGLAAAGFVPSTNNFPGYFFLITLAHFAHAVAGAILILIALLRALGGTPAARLRVGLDVTAFVWHFVGLIWLAIWFVLTD
jgi:cytochrome c oxidase subunit III